MRNLKKIKEIIINENNNFIKTNDTIEKKYLETLLVFENKLKKRIT